MSVGNLKDQGNQGKNFPFQLRLLQLLGTIAANTGGSSGSVSRIPALTRVSGAGLVTITAGSQEVSIYNAGSASATVLGSTLKQGERVTYTAKGLDTVGAITYDPLTSELLISTLT